MIEILDEDTDTRSKKSHEIIDIDAIPDFSNSYKYKRKRAVFLNHCIEKISLSSSNTFQKFHYEGYQQVSLPTM